MQTTFIFSLSWLGIIIDVEAETIPAVQEPNQRKKKKKNFEKKKAYQKISRGYKEKHKISS